MFSRPTQSSSDKTTHFFYDLPGELSFDIMDTWLESQDIFRFFFGTAANKIPTAGSAQKAAFRALTAKNNQDPLKCQQRLHINFFRRMPKEQKSELTNDVELMNDIKLKIEDWMQLPHLTLIDRSLALRFLNRLWSRPLDVSKELINQLSEIILEKDKHNSFHDNVFPGLLPTLLGLFSQEQLHIFAEKTSNILLSPRQNTQEIEEYTTIEKALYTCQLIIALMENKKSINTLFFTLFLSYKRASTARVQAEILNTLIKISRHLRYTTAIAQYLQSLGDIWSNENQNKLIEYLPIIAFFSPQQMNDKFEIIFDLLKKMCTNSDYKNVFENIKILSSRCPRFIANFAGRFLIFITQLPHFKTGNFYIFDVLQTIEYLIPWLTPREIQHLIKKLLKLFDQAGVAAGLMDGICNIFATLIQFTTPESLPDLFDEIKEKITRTENTTSATFYWKKLLATIAQSLPTSDDIDPSFKADLSFKEALKKFQNSIEGNTNNENNSAHFSTLFALMPHANHSIVIESNLDAYWLPLLASDRPAKDLALGLIGVKAMRNHFTPEFVESRELFSLLLRIFFLPANANNYAIKNEDAALEELIFLLEKSYIHISSAEFHHFLNETIQLLSDQNDFSKGLIALNKLSPWFTSEPIIDKKYELLNLLISIIANSQFALNINSACSALQFLNGKGTDKTFIKEKLIGIILSKYMDQNEERNIRSIAQNILSSWIVQGIDLQSDLAEYSEQQSTTVEWKMLNELQEAYTTRPLLKEASTKTEETNDAGTTKNRSITPTK